MTGAEYTRAVEWIALNDEPTDMDEDSVKDTLTVSLLSFIRKYPDRTVAADVIRYRKGQLEPTDDEIYNPPGIDNDAPGSLGENDWRL